MPESHDYENEKEEEEDDDDDARLHCLLTCAAAAHILWTKFQTSLEMKSVVTCTVFFNGIVSAFKAEEPCMENPARLCVVLVAKNSGNPTFEGRILLAMKWVLCFALLIIFTVKSNKT